MNHTSFDGIDDYNNNIKKFDNKIYEKDVYIIDNYISFKNYILSYNRINLLDHITNNNFRAKSKELIRKSVVDNYIYVMGRIIELVINVEKLSKPILIYITPKFATTLYNFNIIIFDDDTSERINVYSTPSDFIIETLLCEYPIYINKINLLDESIGNEIKLIEYTEI